MMSANGTTPEATVTITESEYERLIKQDLWAIALEQAGVDNWVGYEYATEFYSEFIDENNL